MCDCLRVEYSFSVTPNTHNVSLDEKSVHSYITEAFGNKKTKKTTAAVSYGLIHVNISYKCGPAHNDFSISK